MPASTDPGVYSDYQLNVLGIIKYILEDVLHMNDLTVSGILHTVTVLWDVYAVLAFILSAFLIVGIIYAYLRGDEYYEMEDEALDRAHETWVHLHQGKAGQSNERWNDVLTHSASERPNDWKLAIIEADIVLGDALKEKGYAGASIGEQLKSISPNQMESLRDAWDAHMIRNRIAHEGSDFVLTQKEAREAVIKYERALKELGAV